MKYKNTTLTILFQIFWCFLFSENKNVSAPEIKHISFLENKGQMVDMNNNPIPFVLFKTGASGMDVYITEKGLTYVFLKNTEINESDETETSKIEWHRVDMTLKNANIKKENSLKEGESKNFYQYFLAHCKQGISNVHSYEKITIKEIYKGIDWVLYNSNQFGFKYDFIIHPNANPDQIKLIYEGSGRLEINNNQIHFDNQIGEINEGKLFCYQEDESNEVESKYTINKINNTQYSIYNQQSITNNNQLETLKIKSEMFSYEIGIQLNNYNKSKLLIIDPQLTWATFYGGSDLDGPTSLTADPSGNVFTTGYVQSTDFPVSNPGGTTYYQGTIATAVKDCFVMKFNNAGVLLWSTYYGGSLEDQGNAICTDAAGNVFVTGFTLSNDIPTLNPGAGAYFQPNNAFAGVEEILILKFTNIGTLLWATYYGGFGYDIGNSICCDPFGNVIIGGQTRAGNMPTFPPAGGGYYQGIISSAPDACILKFSNTGVQLWGTYYGGSDIDGASSVCADASGNIFVTGFTRSNDFPVINSGGTAYFQAALAGTNYDCFISKFSPTAVQLWSTFYGANGSDEGNSICSDLAGNIFVVGKTSSNAFPTLNPGGGVLYQAAFGGGGFDAFILKFDNTQTRIWATYYGGGGDENFNSEKTVTVDNCQSVYVAINTYSPVMPTKQPCAAGHYYDNSYNGGREVFLSKFSNSGVQQWGTYFGGNGDDFRQAIDVDNAGNLFVGGEWTEENLVTISPGTYPLVNPGGSALYDGSFNGPTTSDDGFIAKFKPTTINSSATSTNAVCTCNGTATGNGTGGCSPYQYLWYNSSWTQIGNTQTINNLCAGVYHVIVRDSSSCSLSDTSTVTITSSGGTVNTAQSITICTGSSYTLPGGNPVNIPGTYYDTLIAFGGCDSIITTNLSIINAITFTQNATVCSGNNYALPGGTPVNTAGTYYDTLIASGGCDSIITTNLTLIPSVTNSQSASICNGNIYTLPSGTLVNTAGVYHDTLNASNGCDSIIVTTLTIVPALTSSQNVNICNGNNYTLPGGNTVNTAGTYTDTITAQGGCDSIITTILTLVLPVTNTQNASICPGNNYTLPGGNSVNIPGTYTDTVSTIIGCDSIVITILSLLPPIISTQNPNICSGNNFTLPSGSTVNTAGTYTDTVSTIGGCDSIITTALTVNTLPTAVSGLPLQLSCIITSGTISASTSTVGASYNWSGPGIVSGANTFNPTVNATGTYTVTITDSVTGCTNTTTVAVTNNTPLPNVNAGASQVLPCNPQTATINASSTTPNVTYNWSGPGIVSGGNTFNPIVNATGTYTVTVVDPITGCSNTSTVNVTNAPNPNATVSSNVTIVLGSSTILIAGGGNAYAWTPTINITPITGNTVTVNPVQTTMYCVEVTDNNGCKDTACVIVSVEIPCPTNESLQVPNAFSPNADGVNDEICLQGWDTCIEKFSIIIFDRWGEKVFESIDPNFCWDGTYKNTIMDAQVFVYYIKAKFLNLDESILRKGNISLIK